MDKPIVTIQAAQFKKFFQKWSDPLAEYSFSEVGCFIKYKDCSAFTNEITGLNFAINGNSLYRLFSTLKTNQTIEFNGASFKSGRMKGALPELSNFIKPEFESRFETDFCYLDQLMNAMSFTTKEEARYALDLIRTLPDERVVYATDGHRLFIERLVSDCEVHDLCFPAVYIPKLNKAFGGVSNLKLQYNRHSMRVIAPDESSWFQFSLSTQTLPDIRKILDVKKLPLFKVSAEHASSIVGSALAFSDTISKKLVLSLRDGKVKIESGAVATGHVDIEFEEVEIFQEEDKLLYVNGKYLEEAFRKFVGPVIVSLDERKSMLTLESGSITVVVMLMSC